MNNFPTVPVLADCRYQPDNANEVSRRKVAPGVGSHEAQKSTVVELPEGPDHFCGGGITLDSSLQLDGEGQEVPAVRPHGIDLAADLKLSSKTVATGQWLEVHGPWRGSLLRPGRLTLPGNTSSRP